MARLLVARPGVELKPDEIPRGGHVRRHYHASRPTALRSRPRRGRFRGRLSGEVRSTNTCALGVGGPGADRSPPTDSTVAPSSTCASTAKDRGIRNSKTVAPLLNLRLHRASWPDIQ